MNFALDLAAGMIGGVSVDVRGADPQRRRRPRRPAPRRPTAINRVVFGAHAVGGLARRGRPRRPRSGTGAGGGARGGPAAREPRDAGEVSAMPFDASRRVFLRGAGLAAVGVGMAPSSLLVRTALAAAGGAEGAGQDLPARRLPTGSTSACPTATPTTTTCAAASPCRARARPAASSTSTATSACTPSSAPLEPLFRDGPPRLHPRRRQPGREPLALRRPGLPGVRARRATSRPPTGWLDRAIAEIPGREVTQAVSFSSQLVRSFLGPEPVLVAQTLTSFDLRARNWRAEAETLLTRDVPGRSDAVGDQRARDLRGHRHAAARADAAALERRRRTRPAAAATRCGRRRA